MKNPFDVVRDFEAALCEYTGAPYAVTTTSCTMALLLAVAWHLRGGRLWSEDGRAGMLTNAADCAVVGAEVRQCVSIPKHTYVSVPQSIWWAGGKATFRDEYWRGAYRLKPLPVWDSARHFSGGMFPTWIQDLANGQRYEEGNPRPSFVCVSFHASKTLGDTQGGAILHDNPEADAWLRRARFDGRTEGVAPKDDTFEQIGWHCYMSPDVAARLLHKLSVLPRHNEPLPNDDYPDLSKMEIFR